MKKGSAKNSGRYFDICKYALLNISKVYQHKIFLGIFRFASMLFLNIWKWSEEKNSPRSFEICKYTFLNI